LSGTSEGAGLMAQLQGMVPNALGGGNAGIDRAEMLYKGANMVGKAGKTYNGMKTAGLLGTGPTTPPPMAPPPQVAPTNTVVNSSAGPSKAQLAQILATMDPSDPMYKQIMLAMRGAA
jgi:hypothetical protein